MKKRENMVLRKGYRFLNAGEVIKEGDIFWHGDLRLWSKVKITVGWTWRPYIIAPVARKVKR